MRSLNGSEMTVFQDSSKRSRDRPHVSAFAQSVGVNFLGLIGLYALYGWGAFVSLGENATTAGRLVMVLGPTVVALSFLIAPALFGAAVTRFDLFGGEGVGIRIGHLAQLGLYAVASFLVSAVGPTIVVALLPAVHGQPAEVVDSASRSVIALGSFMTPLSISILTLLCGFAGALVGLATQAWQPLRRCVTAWFASLILIASFLVPFLASVDAIVHHGASLVWIVAGPLALPLLLTGALAWHQRGSIGFGVGAGRFRARSDALDPEVVDRIISEVAGGLEPGVDAPARTESEAEMAQLAAAIRHVAAPQATMSEARVQQVVADILAKSPAPAPMRPDDWRPRIAAGAIGIFCAAWACLAAGLLIVSPLGGVPPSVVSAVAVGFLGSAGVLWIGRRSPALAATLQT